MHIVGLRFHESLNLAVRKSFLMINMYKADFIHCEETSFSGMPLFEQESLQERDQCETVEYLLS